MGGGASALQSRELPFVGARGAPRTSLNAIGSGSGGGTGTHTRIRASRVFVVVVIVVVVVLLVVT
jgi:hypothetical protein